jgi:hypothetical protein
MAGKTINITPLKQLIRLYTNGVSLNTIVKEIPSFDSSEAASLQRSFSLK